MIEAIKEIGEYTNKDDLTKDSLEKLRQHKGSGGKLEHNEDGYPVVKLRIDNNLAKWDLSNQENILRTLSRHAFFNYLVRKKGKDKCDEEHKKRISPVKKVKAEEKDTKEMEMVLKKLQELAQKFRY